MEYELIAKDIELLLPSGTPPPAGIVCHKFSPLRLAYPTVALTEQLHVAGAQRGELGPLMVSMLRLSILQLELVLQSLRAFEFDRTSAAKAQMLLKQIVEHKVSLTSVGTVTIDCG